MFTRISVTIVFIGLLSMPVFLTRRIPGGSNLPDQHLDSVISEFGFYLQEVSEQSGISFTHQAPVLDPLIDPILPQIASMGASVSVCDFDRDGWNDFYVTNSRYGSQNALYHNLKDGRFSDVAGEKGLADLNTEGTGVSMGSVWADYDNDGYEDLFIYKWGQPELFRNDKGSGFINITVNSGLPRWINANSAIWFDYDSDGLVDLFIGGYFREDIDLWHLKTTRILTESFEYSQNGGRNYLMKNMGDGTFKDVTLETGLTSTRWTLAAGAADLNADGFPELIIANDYSVDEFYFNDKGKRFTEQGNNTMIGFSPKSGMNVSFGDVYNRGEQGIYISNIMEEGILLQGNNFWVPVRDKDKVLYINAAGKSGIESGGWSYGAQFGDLNNDGYVDLYVANGYISGKKGTSYWYDYTKITGGHAAIISDLKNWPAMDGRSQSGYQQNKIWINNGSGHFRDVANYVAEPESFDSRAVAFADLWNRGTTDVIVANQNNRLVVYKNHTDPDNHWIAFELQGIKGNLSAIGASVELKWNQEVQTRIVNGGIGFCSQNQRRLLFGLGKNPQVDRAVVTWPDGKKQILENPQIDTINRITEIP